MIIQQYQTMSVCLHTPGPPLAHWVDWFWFYDDMYPDHSREHVLPDGTFELIINLQAQPRKLFDRLDASRYQSFRRGWLSGSQSEYLVIDALPDSSMIGVHFKPGGIAPFLDFPADELGDRVVELDAIWGLDAWHWRDRLLAAPTPREKFQVLEQLLVENLTTHCAISPGGKRVTWALNRFLEQPHLQNIRRVADQLGVSHKHFIDDFRRRVGVTPKLFCRIRRFQEVLSQINRCRSIEWAEVALSCGYYDQAHFVNDFQAFAGLNPTAYLRYPTEYPNFTRAADEG
jgi:AraC-like DNA-binding protein